MSATLERPVGYGRVPTPDRSLEQRRDALVRANDIRIRRARLKRDIKAGRKTGVQIIDSVPEYTATMKVFDLLLAMPILGPMKARRIMVRCEISDRKTLGGLSARQRRVLIRALNSRDWQDAPRYQEAA